jgi:hypothetical protein
VALEQAEVIYCSDRVESRHETGFVVAVNRRFMNIPKRTVAICFLAISFLILSCSLAGVTGSTDKAKAPTPTAIPGWEKFSGGGIELWMPESFDGGDLANNLDIIIERLRSLGPEFEKLAETLEQNPSAIVLLVYDTKIGPTGFLTNVNVVKEKVVSSMTLDLYLKSSSKQMASYGFRVSEQKIIRLDNYEAGRLVIQADALQAKEAIYVIKVKNTMWVITYATGSAEFSARLPTFDQSANTIYITP